MGYVKIPVSVVTVWIRGESKKDKIIIQTEAPSPERQNSKNKLVINIEVANGKGKEYVEKYFNVSPLVIEEKTGNVLQVFSEENAALQLQAQPQIQQQAPTPVVQGSTSAINEHVKLVSQSVESKQASAQDRTAFFYTPKPENINSWKALCYGGEFYSLYGNVDGEWHPFITKATYEEALAWFNSKGKSYGDKVLADAESAD